jgi:hypothetical protein
MGGGQEIMALHVKYFQGPGGPLDIWIPPTDDIRCPKRFIECEANTLREVDILRDKLVQRRREEIEREGKHDEAAFAEERRIAIQSLTTKMQSSATSPYEKEFIRLYLELRDEEKREKYRKAYLCDIAAQSHFEAREHDRKQTPEEFMGESL